VTEENEDSEEFRILRDKKLEDLHDVCDIKMNDRNFDWKAFQKY